MKIYYSPFYDLNAYFEYDKKNVAMSVTAASSAQLLEQFELRMGLSHSDKDIDILRQKAYHQALDSAIPHDHIIRQSFNIDDVDNEKFSVTAELLSWRDALIMAGWKGEVLQNEIIAVLAEAERQLSPDSDVRLGIADRWRKIADAPDGELPEYINIEVRYPQLLIEPVILNILKRMGAEFKCDFSQKQSLDTTKSRIIEFDDLMDAYRWLMQQPTDSHQIVVCQDVERLDSMQIAFNKATSGNQQVNAHHVVSDIRDVVDVPQSLIWLDCNGDMGIRYPYAFMTDSDISELSNMLNTTIPSHEDMLLAVQNHIYSILNTISGTHIYVTSKFDCGSVLPEHPLVTLLKYSNIQTEHVKITYALQPEKQSMLFCEQEKLKVNTKFDISDNIMSYSSVTNLIQSPFDYVLEKEAKLYDPSDSADIRTVKGKVAHKVVELMIKNYNKELDLSKFDTVLIEALSLEENKLLSNEENALALADFTIELKDSLTVLQRIIQNNDLEIVESEMSIPSADERANGCDGVIVEKLNKCIAFIDLVLKKKATSDYYIFDFKYSTSETYSNKLKDNKSIQFEIYRRIFNQYGPGKVKACGYYLFPLKTLFMTEDDFHASGFVNENDITVVEQKADALTDPWKAIVSSYQYRKQQLNSGEIEQCENMDMTKLEYNKEKGLFPLESAYKKEKIKAGPYSPKHIVLKNQIR